MSFLYVTISTPCFPSWLFIFSSHPSFLDTPIPSSTHPSSVHPPTLFNHDFLSLQLLHLAMGPCYCSRRAGKYISRAQSTRRRGIILRHASRGTYATHKQTKRQTSNRATRRKQTTAKSSSSSPNTALPFQRKTNPAQSPQPTPRNHEAAAQENAPSTTPTAPLLWTATNSATA